MGGRGQQHNEAAITPAWTPRTSPQHSTGAESAKETVKVLRSRDTGIQGGYRMERRVTKNSMYRGEQHNIYFSVFHSVPKITLGSLIRLIGYFISLNIFVFVPPDCCYARYSAALLQCLRESIQMERRSGSGQLSPSRHATLAARQATSEDFHQAIVTLSPRCIHYIGQQTRRPHSRAEQDTRMWRPGLLPNDQEN